MITLIILILSLTDCLQRRQNIQVLLKTISPSNRIEMRLFTFQVPLANLSLAHSVFEMLTDFIASLES